MHRGMQGIHLDVKYMKFNFSVKSIKRITLVNLEFGSNIICQ